MTGKKLNKLIWINLGAQFLCLRPMRDDAKYDGNHALLEICAMARNCNQSLPRKGRDLI